MPWTRWQFATVKSLIWPWGQSSRLKVTNNGTRHIVWRWSWTTKKIQPGYDLLRTHEQTDHYRASATNVAGPLLLISVIKVMMPGFQTKEWVSDCCLTQLSNCLAISWREHVNFQWNNDGRSKVNKTHDFVIGQPNLKSKPD